MVSRKDLETLGESRAANVAVVGGSTVISTVVSIAALFLWLGYDPTLTLEAEVPGRDGLPVGDAAKLPSIDLTGVLETSDGIPSDLGGSWTSFRGPNGANIAVDAPALAESWSEDGPEVVWSIPVGDGYASPSVLNGRVYIMDYDVEKRADALRCLSLSDGKEIWRRSYAINIKRNHGMSRTIPAVTARYVVSMGPKCHVVCLDSASGDFRWGIDLQKDYGTEEPLWYAGQCPLIEDGKVIIAPAGTDTLMMAVDCNTGDVVWKTPNPNGWNMSHSSIIPMTLLGKRMYVYAAIGGIVGVSAEAEDAGALLWDIQRTVNVVAPSAVQAGEDLIFVTAGYGKGSRLLKLHEEDGAITVELIYDKTAKEVLACEQQTPIYHDGLLYGIMPKDAGAMKGQFVCYRPDGTLVWSSGRDNRFGLGPFLMADDKFFILDDEGTLTMIDARKRRYVQLAQAEILHGHDAWGPLALAGSRMLLRDMNNLACIELGAKS